MFSVYFVVNVLFNNDDFKLTQFERNVALT